MLPIYLYSRNSEKLKEEFDKKNRYLQMKYKDDKERLAAEQMDLMKKYGFFPGGMKIIPSIIQMIFMVTIGSILRGSIALHSASFLGWMTDITKPDIWFLLPTIFVMLMYIQISSTVSTPMKKIGMILISLVAFFIISKFSVGMLLFFITSSLFASLQKRLFGV